MSVLSQRLESPRRKRVVKNPLPWYTPRFWHGMRASSWISHLADNRFRISPSRLPTVLSISGFSCINSVVAALDRLVYGRRVDEVELKEPPLFILGHWRSGTTFLHELLIRDPAHTFPNTYQCFVPHHFVLTEAWFAPLTEGLLPNRRPMDNMAAGWKRPQEDEFALGNMGMLTPYLSMTFPQHGPAYPEYLDLCELSSTQREAWKCALKGFYQRIAFRDNRRIVSKSPAHTARVRTLLEMFPGAKFVHIVRDPYEVFASTVNLWRSLNETQRLQRISAQEWLEEYVLDSHQRMYAAFEADRELLADNQIYDVHYENLQGDPQIIARRKAVQRQLALNRMGDKVPQADVVVTNPTELAVAIQYQPGQMNAPVVVAKGAGLIAQRIRRLALEHNIPVVERKPLAQLLYKEVEVNHPVPDKSYAAVAEVLAYVYQLKGKKMPGAKRAA